MSDKIPHSAVFPNKPDKLNGLANWRLGLSPRIGILVTLLGVEAFVVSCWMNISRFSPQSGLIGFIKLLGFIATVEARPLPGKFDLLIEQPS